MADNRASWSLDSLWSKLRELKETARRQVDRLTVNNGRIVELDKRSNAIVNVRSRELAKSEIRKLVSNQASIAGRMRRFDAMWRDLIAKVREFLSKVRVPMPSGLSAPIVIVPVIVTGAVLLAVAYVWKIKLDNDRQDKLIDERKAVVEAMLSGQIAPSTAQQLISELNRTSPATGGDVLGISSILSSAGPLALAAVAVVVIPRLIRQR